MSLADDLRPLAVEVARAAGDLLLEHRTRTLSVESKTSATDPVTEADRASEALIARRLLDARPDDGLLGEEDADNRRGSTGIRWVVDPLDATVNFTYGLPHWCVSIAAEGDDGPLVGVVHDPVRDELFTAVRGGGATLGDQPLAVTDVADLGHTLVATGFSYEPATRADQGEDLAQLLRTVRDVRRAGSAALDLAWVAAGRVDAYLEFGLSPWDWAAGRLLVTEAGGAVTSPRRHLGGRERVGVVAGGGPAHDGLVTWLQEHPRSTT